MSRFTSLAVIAATTCLSLASPSLAQTGQDDARFSAAQSRFNNELQVFQQEFDRYQAARNNRRGYNDPRYQDQRYQDQRGNYADDRVESNYDPARYYRNGPNYQERVLTQDDRIYRGNDGRYYCKRNDGTTGLIVGAVAGGVLGNVIDGGHSRSVGTILGALVGGVAGQSIDRNSNSNNNQVRCR